MTQPTEPKLEEMTASVLAAAVMDAMHTHGRHLDYGRTIEPLFQLQGNLGHAQKGIQRTWQLAALAGHALQEELQAKSHIRMDFDLLQAADRMGAAIIKRGNDWAYRELTFLASEAIDEQIHARAEEISTVLIPEFFDHLESLIDEIEPQQ
jgi:hypothetical protein